MKLIFTCFSFFLGGGDRGKVINMNENDLNIYLMELTLQRKGLEKPATLKIKFAINGTIHIHHNGF